MSEIEQQNQWLCLLAPFAGFETVFLEMISMRNMHAYIHRHTCMCMYIHKCIEIHACIPVLVHKLLNTYIEIHAYVLAPSTLQTL